MENIYALLNSNKYINYWT